jgi:hypothetical protein
LARWKLFYQKWKNPLSADGLLQKINKNPFLNPWQSKHVFKIASQNIPSKIVSTFFNLIFNRPLPTSTLQEKEVLFVNVPNKSSELSLAFFPLEMPKLPLRFFLTPLE